MFQCSYKPGFLLFLWRVQPWKDFWLLFIITPSFGALCKHFDSSSHFTPGCFRSRNLTALSVFSWIKMYSQSSWPRTEFHAELPKRNSSAFEFHPNLHCFKVISPLMPLVGFNRIHKLQVAPVLVSQLHRSAGRQESSQGVLMVSQFQQGPESDVHPQHCQPWAWALL